jgi:2-amino-4-hydroxy-6-hydroxymethyldihydropteridine diphosphokinase
MRYSIGIGGNTGDVPATFTRAVTLISDAFGEVLKVSEWYYSRPLPVEGAEIQQEYLNAVLMIETGLDPEVVLQKLLEIELCLGRDRSGTHHWGPRTIDLDILCAEDMVYHSTTLDIPHPHMCARDFVLRPLLELDPHWIHPEKNVSLDELYNRLPESERYIDRKYDPE